MQVNMGSWVNDMEMFNTFSVSQWRTFSLRPLNLLQLRTVVYRLQYHHFISDFFLFRFVSRERDGHQHDFTLHVKGDVCNHIISTVE